MHAAHICIFSLTCSKVPRAHPWCCSNDAWPLIVLNLVHLLFDHLFPARTVLVLLPEKQVFLTADSPYPMFVFLLQVCLAVQVPGQQSVAADRPARGEGGVGHPHSGTLWRWRVDHQVQRSVPHGRKTKLDLLQRPDWKQQGQLNPNTLMIK